MNYGKIAHIHGRKTKAERFEQAVFDDKVLLHGFDNLLLLCGKHHDQIDQTGAEKFYTADLVRQWKSDHLLKAAAELDREWVFGGHAVCHFDHEGQLVEIRGWSTKAGDFRFYFSEQLAQVRAARDMSIMLGQFRQLLATLELYSGKPSDPYHVSEDDSHIRELKKLAYGLRRPFGKSNTQDDYETAMHRVYDNLGACSDITLSELAEVGTVDRTMRTTVFVGEDGAARTAAFLAGFQNKPRR